MKHPFFDTAYYWVGNHKEGCWERTFKYLPDTMESLEALGYYAIASIVAAGPPIFLPTKEDLQEVKNRYNKRLKAALPKKCKLNLSPDAPQSASNVRRRPTRKWG